MSFKSTHMQDRFKPFVIKALILIFAGVCIGFMINFFSPLATLSMPPEERGLFWVSLCLVGGLGIFLCDLILTGFKVEWPEWAEALLKSICGTIAVLIPLYIFYDPAVIPRFGTTILFVWLVMILILAGTTILSWKFLRTQTQKTDILNHIEQNEALAKTPPQILSRLPIHLQSGELYALSAEDHYVRVHTSKGDELVLMRFSDALLETGDVDGLQIHRSWWVAKAAITEVKSKGRSAEITLKNACKAPVSRNERKRIRELGWI